MRRLCPEQEVCGWPPWVLACACTHGVWLSDHVLVMLLFQDERTRNPRLTECRLHSECSRGPGACLPSRRWVLCLLIVGVMAQAPGMVGPDPPFSEGAGAAACPFLADFFAAHFLATRTHSRTSEWEPSLRSDPWCNLLNIHTVFSFQNLNASWLVMHASLAKASATCCCVIQSVTYFIYQLSL